MNKMDTTLQDFGLDLLSEEERNEFLADIGEVLFESVMSRVWGVLTLEKQGELVLLFEASNADPENEQKREAVAVFLETNVPDFERFVAEEVASLRKEQEAIYGELTS